MRRQICCASCVGAASMPAGTASFGDSTSPRVTLRVSPLLGRLPMASRRSSPTCAHLGSLPTSEVPLPCRSRKSSAASCPRSTPRLARKRHCSSVRGEVLRRPSWCPAAFPATVLRRRREARGRRSEWKPAGRLFPWAARAHIRSVSEPCEMCRRRRTRKMLPPSFRIARSTGRETGASRSSVLIERLMLDRHFYRDGYRRPAQRGNAALLVGVLRPPDFSARPLRLLCPQRLRTHCQAGVGGA